MLDPDFPLVIARQTAVEEFIGRHAHLNLSEKAKEIIFAVTVEIFSASEALAIIDAWKLDVGSRPWRMWIETLRRIARQTRIEAHASPKSSTPTPVAKKRKRQPEGRILEAGAGIEGVE